MLPPFYRNRSELQTVPAADLRSAGSSLVHRLGGIWYGDHGMCRCPAHADRTPSLSVRLGERALLYTCFAGCDRRDVIRAIGRIGHTIEFGGSSIDAADHHAKLDGWLRQRAQDLWSVSRPVGGTQGAAYLQRRGLVAVPHALRFCKMTPLGRGRDVCHRPALVAAVQDGAFLLAVQRTFLEAGRPRRARDLGNPRRMLGRPYGGAVMLAPAGMVLGLAEGVETAMSARLLLGIPVWATLGSKRLSAINLPAHVEHVVLLPDQDAAGKAGADKALSIYAATGRRVSVLWPPPGLKDWNDVLRDGGKGGRMGGARWTEWLARCRQE